MHIRKEQKREVGSKEEARGKKERVKRARKKVKERKRGMRIMPHCVSFLECHKCCVLNAKACIPLTTLSFLVQPK